MTINLLKNKSRRGARLTLGSVLLAVPLLTAGCDSEEDEGDTGAGTAGASMASTTGDSGGNAADESGGDYGGDGDDYGGSAPVTGEVDSCCAPNDLPGCSDPDLEACVCDADPLCCGAEDGVWDAVCVDQAITCGGC